MSQVEQAEPIELSVVIPAYNAEATIRAAMASAARAGATQIVVVDDGSTDATAEVARSLGATVLVQANRGAAAARRAGVAVVTGSAVILLDADDTVLEAGVRESLALFERSPSAFAAVAGPTIAVLRSGRQVTIHTPGSEISLHGLLRDGFSPSPPAALLWSRVALEQAMFGPLPGLWPRYSEDYELVIRGSLCGPIGFHTTPCARYQLEGGKSTRDPMNSIRASEKIRQHYIELLGLALPEHGEPQLRSRAILRTAMDIRADVGSRDPRWVRAVVHAALLDPLLVSRLAWKSIRR